MESDKTQSKYIYFLTFLNLIKMKKLSFIMVLVVLIGQITFAQKPVDSKGRVIDAKGNVYLGGTKLGTITADSIIKNAQGKKVALVKQGGIVVDAKGKTIGKMGKDGQTYYNADGQTILSVKDRTDSETCDILDANGKVIGNIHRSYKPMVCAIHCLDNKMNPKTHKKMKK